MTAARVVTVDGQTVLIDPVAVAVAEAVAKHNCRRMLDLQRERVDYFKARIRQLGRSPADVVIVLVNADDPRGEYLADVLMPGRQADWAAMRARGEIPFARGLAERRGMQEIIGKIDPACAEKLRAMETAVVVVDYGTVEAFEV